MGFILCSGCCVGLGLGRSGGGYIYLSRRMFVVVFR